MPLGPESASDKRAPFSAPSGAAPPLAESLYGAGGEESRPVLLAVAEKEAASAVATAVMKAGLVPSAIDVSFLAVARALNSRCLSRQHPAAVVLVVVETTSIHFVIVQGDATRFSRGTPHTGGALDGTEPGVLALASEIRSVLDFYGTQIGDRIEVQAVVVWADWDVPDGFEARMSEALGGLPVTISTPSSITHDADLLDGRRAQEKGARLPVGPEGASHERAPFSWPTACAIGLAMRNLAGVAFPANLNLLPEATVRLQALKRRALITAILAASLFLVSLLAVVAAHWRLRAVDRDVQGVRKSLATVAGRPLGQRAERDIARISAELGKREVCLQSVQDAIPWPALLPEISRRIPRDARLTAMRAQPEGGLALEGEALSLGSVHRFAACLADSDLIGSARVAHVVTVKRGDGWMFDYRIVCGPAEPAGAGR